MSKVSFTLNAMRIVETSADASPVRGRCVLKSTVPALFDTTLLTDESAVDAAIGRVEALVAHPVAPLKDIVVELFLAPSKALEFVLAGKNLPTCHAVGMSATSLITYYVQLSMKRLTSSSEKPFYNYSPKHLTSSSAPSHKVFSRDSPFSF